MKFKDKLRELRELENMTPYELGSYLDVSADTILKWETGKKFPSINKLKELSLIFNISIDELVEKI